MPETPPPSTETTTSSTPPATDTGTTPPPPSTETPQQPETFPALESERKLRRDADKRARDLEAELATLRTASLSDQEKAVEAARNEGRNEGLRRVVEAEVRAAAAGKLANPALAAKLLDVDSFIPTDGGEVSAERIGAALEELLAANPYLRIETPGSTPPAPAGAPPAAPAGTAPGGARGGPNSVAGSFSRSQLRDPVFYAANKDAILKAAQEGRITQD